MLTWVIGAGGLFGSALVRASEHCFTGPAIPWSDPTAALTALTRTLDDFSDKAEDNWCIAWAAGRVTTASPQADADQELEFFTEFIQHLRDNPPPGRGVFLLTSSAGGIYAGSTPAPLTSDSSVAPLGTYGNLKRAQEVIAGELAPEIPVVTARVSNLYGPGQDLRKLQGVISRLALAAVTREPITMFVPLDTMRDYLYADDAAIRALHWAQQTQACGASSIRVVASGQPVTLGHVIALMNDITRVRIPIASGVHDSARAQARDLRLTPDTDAFTQRLELTSLPAGMKRVFLDIRQRHADATLSA